jgi:hypothetical protein
VAHSVIYNEEDQLPLGRTITAMTLDFEEMDEWDNIRERIRADRAREAQDVNATVNGSDQSQNRK